MELIRDLWTRAWAVHGPLSSITVVVIGAVAFGLVLAAWPVVRSVITVCHEGGHALVAVLSGRQLAGIRLHSDTSGLTVTRGRPRGPGMVATLLAGYPAASLLGIGAAALASVGYSAAVLWVGVGLLAVMLLKVRNIYGFLVVLGLGAGVGLVSWYAQPLVLAWLGHAVAWLLLLGGPRPVLELLGHGRHPRAQVSDAHQLAQLTHVPRLVWITLWLALGLGALVVGGRWLLLGLPVPAS